MKFALFAGLLHVSIALSAVVGPEPAIATNTPKPAAQLTAPETVFLDKAQLAEIKEPLLQIGEEINNLN